MSVLGYQTLRMLMQGKYVTKVATCHNAALQESRTAIWKDENQRTHPGHCAYFEVSRAAVLATRRSLQIHAISG